MKRFIVFLIVVLYCTLSAESITGYNSSNQNSFRGYQIGDVVDDFSWEHSNGVDPNENISLATLIASNKAVVLEFSQCWCPPCNAAAPHLEEIWKHYGGLGNNKLYICAALTQNTDHSALTWEQLNGSAWREKHGLTHWLAMADLYNQAADFNTQGIPNAAIIGKDRKLIWFGNPHDSQFEEKIAQAVYGFQNLHPNPEISDQNIDLNSTVNIDLSNSFTTDDDSDWTLEIEENSNEEVIIASLSGKTITLFGQKLGTSIIKLKATSGNQTAFNSFSVTSNDPGTLWAQWGENYDFNDGVGTTSSLDFAVDFHFGENQVDVNSFAVGMTDKEEGLSWKIVKVVDGKITDDVIGDLQGTFNSLEKQETLVSIDSETKITGHVALVINSAGNYCARDDASTSDHTWVRLKNGEWDLLTNLASQFIGAWHIKLGVSQLPGDYEAPSISTISKTVVFEGNDMEIEIGIKDDTGIASVKGIVNINGEESQIDFAASGKKEIPLRNGSKAIYTFKGTIPAQSEAIKGTIKFDMTDSSEEANNIISDEYEIEWEANIDWILNESFEENFPPTGWKLIDADGDGKNWRIYEEPFEIHEGAKSVGSASYEGSILTPDNWLILPKSKGASKMRYWVIAQDANYASDKYGIFVSETDTSPENFIEVFSEVMTAKSPGQWYERTVDLSAYSGKEIYVALRHWDCTDQFIIIFDEIRIDGTLGIESQEVNKEYTLYQNYPNPFNPTTTIKFNLVNDGNVKLKIFNMAGEQVSKLISQKLTAGIHSIKFDGSKLNSGTYFYKLETPSGSIVKKMLLIK